MNQDIDSPDYSCYSADSGRDTPEEKQIIVLELQKGILLSALMGVRGMAQIEAMTGSKTWAKAVQEIDRCLREARCLPQSLSTTEK